MSLAHDPEARGEFLPPRQLRRVLLGVAALAGTFGVLTTYWVERPLPLLAIYAVVVASALAGSRLASSGHARWAAAGFIGVTWLVVSLSSLALGGARSPAFSALIVLVLLAGLLWNERAALVTGVLCAVSASAIALLDEARLPPPIVEITPFRLWEAFAAELVIVLLTVHLAATSVRRNLASARLNARRADEAKGVAERRLRRQEAVARLGARALASRDARVLLDEVVSEVARTLDAELVKILELEPDAGQLLLRSGIGWTEGWVGSARVPTGASSQAGFTLASQIPVLVSDLLSERRFTGPEILTLHGVRSGVSVTIRQDDGVFGILAAHSRAPNAFDDDDAMFLQTVANVLSAALGRARLEGRLSRQERFEALGRLAGGVAHDFNNLLTVILGYADALGQSGGRLDPALAAKEIRGAAERAGAMTRDLLAFARQEPALPRTLDLNEVVSRSARLLERLAGEEVRLRTALASEPCLVRADASQIERMLVNLVVNARDAQPEGGEIAIETRRGVREGEQVVNLLVSDRGSGMPPSVIAHAFEPFFTTKSGDKGSGLGLATVHGLVSQLGGHVSVSSGLGVGTRIEISLPLAIEAPAERAEVLDPETEATPAAGETVLIAEDGAELRGLMRRTLERSGYAVLEAPDGLAACALLAEHPGPIHALITDIVMPGASGFDVVARLRTLRPDTRVLYTSGYVGAEGSLAELQRPDVTFLPKPFRMRELEAALRRALVRTPAAGAA